MRGAEDGGIAVRRARAENRWIEKYKVCSRSSRRPLQVYTVSLAKDGTWGCSCPSWRFRREQCKHIEDMRTVRGWLGKTPEKLQLILRMEWEDPAFEWLPSGATFEIAERLTDAPMKTWRFVQRTQQWDLERTRVGIAIWEAPPFQENYLERVLIRVHWKVK